jgi:hypothetical protein
MKISLGWLKQNIFFKNQKCLAKNLSKLFVSEVFIKKCHFQYAFDDNLSTV